MPIPSLQHGEQAQRSNGGPIACFGRQVVRNAGLAEHLFHHRFHPIQRLLDLVKRCGVAEAHVAFPIGSEAGAGKAGDPRLVEYTVGQLVRADARITDVGESVEGAARFGTPKARDAV